MSDSDVVEFESGAALEDNLLAKIAGLRIDLALAEYKLDTIRVYFCQHPTARERPVIAKTPALDISCSFLWRFDRTHVTKE